MIKVIRLRTGQLGNLGSISSWCTTFYSTEPDCHGPPNHLPVKRVWVYNGQDMKSTA